MNKTVKLYNGKVTILFSDQARNRYVVEEDGHSPVGVTTVLSTLSKPALMTWPLYEGIEWLKKNPDDFEGAEKAYLIKSDKGKDTGTLIHSMIENFLLKQMGEIPAPLESNVTDGKKGYDCFTEWYEAQDIKPLAVESIVYSKANDYAGTYDCLLEIGGKVVLCDVKTTNASRTAPLGIYSEHFLQLGAYSLAHHEETPKEEISDLMIIRVGKDGVLNTLRASDLGLSVEFCQDAFLSVLGAYRFVTPLAKQLKDLK